MDQRSLLVRTDTGRFVRGHDLGDSAHAEDFAAWDSVAGRLVGYDPQAMVDESTAAAFALRGTFAVTIGGVAIECRPAFDHYAAIVEAYTPARVAEICGVSPDELQRAASALINSKSISYHAWTGVAQHTNATQAERAIAVLYALTGHFDKRGGNVQLRRQPINPINPASLLERSQAAKAVGLERLPIGPPTHGWVPVSDVYTAILDRKPYAIRGLIGFGANILVSLAETNRGQAALAALDFHVHCDLFETPTARYADIVLPVNSPWEREDYAPALRSARKPMP